MSSTSPWASSATQRARELRCSPETELWRVNGRRHRDGGALIPLFHGPEEGTPHPHHSLWANIHEGEATKTGSAHPPLPARALCRLPPLPPPQQLGTRAGTGHEPGGTLGHLPSSAGTRAPAGLGLGSTPAPERSCAGWGPVLSRASTPALHQSSPLGPGPAPWG